MSKEELRTKIINYLKEVDGSKSLMGCVIQAGIKNSWNFENIVTLIKEEYKACPDGMTKCIGNVPMRLILSY